MREENDWQEISKRIFGEDRVVWENEYYQFVSNHWSRTVTKNMRKMDIHGIELRGWTAYKLVPKTEDGLTGYIIYDEKGQPYRDFDSAEDALYWVDMYKYTKMFDNDIVTMVEKRMEKGSERMSDAVCPLCGSEILIRLPPFYLRGTPYGHKVSIVCSNNDCRPVDSRIFGEDHGMTIAVVSFYVDDAYYELSDDDRRRYDELMKEHYADVIRKKFIDRRMSE